MNDQIPDPHVFSTRKSGVPLSMVWLVPVAAVGVALYIAWQSYADRGPLIEIAFDKVSGLVAGETTLKFRSLTVGTVEDLHLDDDMKTVIAEVRLDKDIAAYVDRDAKFWIVEPQVTASGVQGLETVLSGSYIEGQWDATPSDPETRFKAENEPPLIREDEAGIVIQLRSEQGGWLQAGSPIVFRGVTVGRIDRPSLALDGSGVTARAVIDAPYDQLINSNTRFWASGGFSVDVGTGGVSLNVANLASIIQGGLTFETMTVAGRPVRNDQTFTVYRDRDTAQRIPVADENALAMTYSAVFAGSLSGLNVGAEVSYGGLPVGRVTDLGVFIAPGTEPGAAGEILMRVDFVLQPEKLGLETDPDGEELRTFMINEIADGLHAQLRNDSLFSSSLSLELVQVADVTDGTLSTDQGPYPVVPSLPWEPTGLQDSAGSLLDRVTALPVEDLLDGAVQVLDNVNALLSSDGVRGAPDAVVSFLDLTRSKVEALDLAPLLTELQATAAEARGAIAGLASAENQASVTTALAQLDTLMADLSTVSQGLPGVLANAETLTGKAAALDLETLVAQLTDTVAAIQAIAAAPETQALPATLNGLLTDARGLVGSESVQALPTAAADALASIQAILAQVQASDGLPAVLTALERADRIAASVEDTTAGLPQLQSQLSSLVSKAQALDVAPLIASATASAAAIEPLANEATALTSSARSLIEDDAVRALPADLAATLARIDALVAEVQDSGGVEALIVALTRLDTITSDIAATTQGLPELENQISDLIAKANALPLDQVVTSADEILQSANALVSSDATAQLPESLATTLDQLALVLQELREGGTVENANQALASAADAAAAIEAAAANLPELSRQLTQLINQAEAVLQTYGGRSTFNAQTLATINEVREAARAVTSLSRTIERNPSSLIRGR